MSLLYQSNYSCGFLDPNAGAGGHACLKIEFKFHQGILLHRCCSNPVSEPQHSTKKFFSVRTTNWKKGIRKKRRYRYSFSPTVLSLFWLWLPSTLDSFALGLFPWFAPTLAQEFYYFNLAGYHNTHSITQTLNFIISTSWRFDGNRANVHTWTCFLNFNQQYNRIDGSY